MKLSTKGRYTIIALVDVARHSHGGCVAVADIAARQDVSLAYLERLFGQLRRRNLLISERGPGGGFRLGRRPEDIGIIEVLEAVGEVTSALEQGSGARGGVSGTAEQGLANRLWESLSAQVHLFLHHTTLADVLEGGLVPCPASQALAPQETQREHS